MTKIINNFRIEDNLLGTGAYRYSKMFFWFLKFRSEFSFLNLRSWVSTFSPNMFNLRFLLYFMSLCVFFIFSSKKVLSFTLSCWDEILNSCLLGDQDRVHSGFWNDFFLFFSTVQLATDLKHGRQVAVKVIPKHNQNAQKALVAELRALCKLRGHQNVVKLHHFCCKNAFFCSSFKSEHSLAWSHSAFWPKVTKKMRISFLITCLII